MVGLSHVSLRHSRKDSPVSPIISSAVSWESITEHGPAPAKRNSPHAIDCCLKPNRKSVRNKLMPLILSLQSSTGRTDDRRKYGVNREGDGTLRLIDPREEPSIYTCQTLQGQNTSPFLSFAIAQVNGSVSAIEAVEASSRLGTSQGRGSDAAQTHTATQKQLSFAATDHAERSVGTDHSCIFPYHPVIFLDAGQLGFSSSPCHLWFSRCCTLSNPILRGRECSSSAGHDGFRHFAQVVSNEMVQYAPGTLWSGLSVFHKAAVRACLHCFGYYLACTDVVSR